jgi:hypothetical protein
MNRQVSFYFMVTGLSIHFILMSILYFGPIRATLAGELSSDHIIISIILLSAFLPISLLCVRVGNRQMKLGPTSWLLSGMVGLIVLMALGAALLKSFIL